MGLTIAHDDEHALIAIADIRDHAPWWPYSVKATYQRIQAGRIPVVRDGRRYFVTRALLREYVHQHTQPARTDEEALARRREQIAAAIGTPTIGTADEG